MGSVKRRTAARGTVLSSPPHLVSMTAAALQREICNTSAVVPTTIVLEYGESSFELVVGPLFKAYDEDGAVSWWVNDRLVGTASNDDSPVVPSPSLVFMRAGWQYPLNELLVGKAA